MCSFERRAVLGAPSERVLRRGGRSGARSTGAMPPPAPCGGGGRTRRRTPGWRRPAAVQGQSGSRSISGRCRTATPCSASPRPAAVEAGRPGRPARRPAWSRRSRCPARCRRSRTSRHCVEQRRSGPRRDRVAGRVDGRSSRAEPRRAPTHARGARWSDRASLPMPAERPGRRPGPRRACVGAVQDGATRPSAWRSTLARSAERCSRLAARQGLRRGTSGSTPIEPPTRTRRTAPPCPCRVVVRSAGVR